MEVRIAMRLAVLSDIHSNIFALEAVLEDLSHYQVNIKINLGDIFYGPIAPKATYTLLQQHEFITICGNQDRQIFQATQQEIDSNATLKFVIEDLGDEPLLWLQTLPSTRHLDSDIFLCHGTPRDDMTYLLEDVSQGFAITKNEKEIRSLLQGIHASLILCGHSHLPKTISLTQMGQVIVNSGSVGLQAYKDEEPCVHSIENACSEASYAIIEKTSDGWSVEHKRVAYDFEKASALALQNGRNDWEYALKTGKVKPV